MNVTKMNCTIIENDEFLYMMQKVVFEKLNWIKKKFGIFD